MAQESLEAKIQRHRNAAEMLRNAPAGRFDYPMQSDFTNWRDEQRAQKETAVIFDLSFHMTDCYFRGPDALRLMSDVGVNSFKNFARNRAKQLVTCNYDGFVIGDAILFAFEDDEFSLVGRPVNANWVAFQAEIGGYDVTVTRDERSVDNDGRRLSFRYQLQGPHAVKIVEKAHGGPTEHIKFFRMGEIEIAGCNVRALNHTMSGVPGEEMTGLEMTGPADQGPAVWAALVEAGGEFGLHQGGARSYPTTSAESGWIAAPVPAIYSGDAMKPFREYLSAKSWEANASIGGSYVSDDI